MSGSRAWGSVSVALLLVNPVVVALLTRSVTVVLLAATVLAATAVAVTRCRSMRVRVWAFNIAALLGVSLTAELLFRELLPDKVLPNLYELHGDYYFNRPLLDRTFRTPEYVSHYRTNCQGLRIDALTNAHDTLNRCDWLFIGDSYTQGAQVDYADLFTSRLFRTFSDMVIVNAGISGAGLYDELAFFRDKGRRLRPQTVFLQIGVFNDFFGISRHRATFQDWLQTHSDLYRYLAYNVFSTDSLPLGRWTEPFFPTRQENVDRNILFRETSPQKEADIRAFGECLAEWKREVESVGAQLVIVLIPSKEQVSSERLAEVTRRYAISPADLDMLRCFPFSDRLGRLFHGIISCIPALMASAGLLAKRASR